jgi:hypothetical protein
MTFKYSALIATAALMALPACTQTSPGTNARLDPTGTYYETQPTNEGVGDNMRNSTASSTSDRMSTRYPVGSASQGSNPY